MVLLYLLYRNIWCIIRYHIMVLSYYGIVWYLHLFCTYSMGKTIIISILCAWICNDKCSKNEFHLYQETANKMCVPVSVRVLQSEFDVKCHLSSLITAFGFHCSWCVWIGKKQIECSKLNNIEIDYQKGRAENKHSTSLK